MSVYTAIAMRRDVRAEFDGSSVDDEVLQRILSAAHKAPSVGNTQPWDFVVIK
ncbi:MAG: nitroreductase family protein, partial [Rhodococcus sp. (in: high G+C Gram-positive bacteria)]